MKIISHEKEYQKASEVIIGKLPEVKQTIVKLELDIRNNPIDEIIYILMCAEEKRTNENKIEQLLAEPRYELAFKRLKEFINKNQ